MIPRFRHALGLHELRAALTPTAEDDVAEFERAFAEVAGQRHAVAFPYGRTGLFVLLKAMGIEGRQIICPAYTCVVVPNAICTSGNYPDFIDSGPDANADLAVAEHVATPDTGALIATSIFGHPVDLDALGRFRSRHPNVAVIQDCAHSFLCEWKGQPVHRQGDAAIFGLNISKTMSSIFGGMVTTDDDDLAKRLFDTRAQLVSHPGWKKSFARGLYLLAAWPAFYPPLFGFTESLRQTGLLDRFTRYYQDDLIDMPRDYLEGLTALEARVGRLQTGRLQNFILSRRTYANYYRERLRNLPGLTFVDAGRGASFSHIAARVGDRPAVMRAAAGHGVQLGEVIEYSVPELPAYVSYRRRGASWPVAALLMRQTINLPLSYRFDEESAGRVVSVLKAVLVDAEPPGGLPC